MAAAIAQSGAMQARSSLSSAGRSGTEPSGPSAWAWALGLGGLLPFVGGAGAVALGWGGLEPERAGQVLAAYAATIAAFLGGVHWGPAMRAGGRPVAPLVWGVVPQLVAWGALALPTGPGLSLLSGLLVACYVADRRLYPAAGLRAWLPLRGVLTAGAAASCTVAAWVTSSA